LAIVAKAHEEICTETEPWYGTKYKLEKLPENVLKVRVDKLFVKFLYSYW